MSPRYIDEADLKAREQEILDRALDIVASHGLTGLTMDKLVSKVPYSKGTVYNHFSSKEDVFIAVCNRNMGKVKEMFLKVTEIDGNNRDKMTAIGFAYLLSVLMMPQHFALVMNAKNEMLDKASDQRREEHECIDKELFAVMHGVIENAVAEGELQLSADVDAQQVSFSMWAMAFGTIALLVNAGKICGSINGMVLEDRVIAHGNYLMDGLGWKPPARDNQELLDCLKKEVFVEEVSVIKDLGIEV